MGEWLLSFVPEGQADRSQARSAWVCSLDIWRGALEVIYAPKVATGLSPGFQPWEPSKQRVRPERARG
jgi:hypothetical protein